MIAWLQEDDYRFRAAFFVVSVIAAVVAAIVYEGPSDSSFILAAVGCGVLSAAIGHVHHRRDWPPVVLLLAVVPFLTMIFLLREATEGAGVTTPLLLVAVVSFALTTSLRLTLIVVAMAIASLLLPAALIGAPRYPASEWGRAAVWAVAGTGTAVVIGWLVAELRMQAGRDPLTGAANYRTLIAELNRGLARAGRASSPLAVLALDLDYFKSINDRFGHQHGDAALQSTVSAWERELREVDVLARAGGEEFVVVLEGASALSALATAHRLQRAMPEPLTCSIGIAEWDRREAPEELLKRADVALYDAKRAGRNCAVIAGGGQLGTPVRRRFNEAAGDYARDSEADPALGTS